jgi:hypothetical protein
VDTCVSDGDPNAHSCSAIRDYHAHATGVSVGQVRGLLVDDEA